MKETAPSLPVVERAVISAILRSSGRLYAVTLAAGITRESFYQLDYQRIYSVMTDVALAGEKPDAVAVGQRMSADDQILVASLFDAIATDDGFQSWLVMLRQMEAARKVRVAALKFIEKSGTCTPDQVRGLLSEFAEVIVKEQVALEGLKIRTLKEEVDEYLNQTIRDSATIPYFPHGTEGRERIKQQKGEMHVICANTGAGKTCLAAGAVRQQLEAGLVVAYYCLESSSVQILGRIAAQFCGIPHYIMRDSAPNPVRLKQFQDCVKEIGNKYEKQLYIRGDETRISTPEAIRADLEWVVRNAGRVDVVVVDFLQFMQVPKFMLTKPHLDQVNYCIEKLHGIFSEFQAAGIVLAQINRAGQQALRENERPGLEHIKDSSVIAQLAHTVSFLYRNQKDPLAVGDAVFYSRKTRNQDPFFLVLKWNGVGYDSEPRFNTEGIR